MFSGECRIFDGMYGMVRQLKKILREEGLDNPGPGGKVWVYSSSDGEVYRRILQAHGIEAELGEA